MKKAIGIDIGGTYLRAAIVDEQGKIFWQQTQATIKNDKQALLDQIVTIIKQALPFYSDVCGIGIGISGPVTPNSGYVHVLPNVGVANFDIVEHLSSYCALPVYVVNDANAAGLAEAILGEGKGHRVVQYVTLSTGVGGGLIIDGKIWTGTHGFAQEIGNMIIAPGQDAPNQSLNEGSFESWCSGVGLIKIAHQNGKVVNTTKEVFERPDCAFIIEEWLQHLGIALSNLINIIEPDIIVLGGGIMKSSKYFFDRLTPIVKAHVYRQLAPNIQIKPSKLGQDAGLIGAALLALHKKD